MTTKISRRTMMQAAGAAGAGLALAGAAGAQEKCAKKEDAAKPCLKFKNEDFYDASGKFKEEAAKDAIVALLKHHGYPVYEGTRENLWVSDYGIGQFAKLGLAARMWVNNPKDGYMLMDIYLLPNQMLPEHWHVAGEGNPPKLEGWLVRHGLSHIVGEGEPNLAKEIEIPKCHMNGTATVKHEVIATPGVFVPLNRAEARHWQYAGPEGAIITEVANVHTNSAVRHSDKVLNDYFLSH
jgi:D-lyxose ketol-isomerase